MKEKITYKTKIEEIISKDKIMTIFEEFRNLSKEYINDSNYEIKMKNINEIENEILFKLEKQQAKELKELKKRIEERILQLNLEIKAINKEKVNEKNISEQNEYELNQKNKIKQAEILNLEKKYKNISKMYNL